MSYEAHFAFTVDLVVVYARCAFYQGCLDGCYLDLLYRFWDITACNWRILHPDNGDPRHSALRLM